MGFVQHTSDWNASVDSVLPLGDLQNSEGMLFTYGPITQLYMLF